MIIKSWLAPYLNHVRHIRWVWFARLVEGILGGDVPGSRRRLTETGLVLCRHSEVVDIVLDEIFDVEAWSCDWYAVHLDPASGVGLLALHVVAGDWRASIELGSLPGQGTGGLGDVVNLDLTGWAGRFWKKKTIDFNINFIHILHSKMTKTCWGNIGNLFVICMRQVTKRHLYHLLGVSDYYVMYKHRAQSVLWNKSLWNFDVSP